MTHQRPDTNVSRRTVLKATGTVAGAGLLGAGTAGSAAAHRGFHREFANWRAREAAKVWERGVRGRPDRTITLTDTGVDARHPDVGPWNGIRITREGDDIGLEHISGDPDDEREVGDPSKLENSGTMGPSVQDGGEGTTQREEHPFRTPPEADVVDATLSWTADTQDIDFYLEDSNGNVVGSSTNFMGPEHIRAPVEGDTEYVLVVIGWLNVTAQYETSGTFFASGIVRETFTGDPVPDVDPGAVDADTPKLVGWFGGTLPRDEDGHGTHVSSIMAGTGQASAVDDSRVVEEEPRAVLTAGDFLEYEVDAAAGEGVYVVAYGEGLDLIIEDPDGERIEYRGVGSLATDTSAPERDNFVAEAPAEETGTYSLYVRPATGELAATARVERVSAGAFVDPESTVGDRTGETPTVHGGIAPNQSILGLQGFGAGFEVLSDHAEWFSETFDLRSCNMSWGGLPNERTGTTGRYERVRQLAAGGILSVSSAGNNGPLTGSTGPSGGDEAVAVVATGPLDGITGYSSGGTVVRSEDGEIHRKPDVTAPGGTLFDFINAAEAGDIDGDERPRDYVGAPGTSMAAPYVNGVAGLVAEAMEFGPDDRPGVLELPDPAGTGYDDVLRLKHVLLATASETAFTAAPYHDAHTPTYDFGERDPYEGYGRVNPEAAVDAVTRDLLPGATDLAPEESASATHEGTVGLGLPEDSRAVAGYVAVDGGDLDVAVSFSHLSGGNRGMAKGDPHLDLFVYDPHPPQDDWNGDPRILARARGREGDASVSVALDDQEAVFVVAKLVNVPGVVNGHDVQAHFDLSLSYTAPPLPAFGADGTRDDGASVFTAGQTVRMELSVDEVTELADEDEVRVVDGFPQEWTFFRGAVRDEDGNVVREAERVGDTVDFGPFEVGRLRDEDLQFVYYARAPDETGPYTFGPGDLELLTDAAVGNDAATFAGTETNTVVGASTSV